MKKIVLFGGEGYIGKVISQYFEKLNFEIISFDNLIYYEDKNKYISKLKNKNFIYGDINDTKLVKKIMKSAHFAVALAGLVGDPITKRYPKESELINTYGTKNLIDTCLDSNLEKFIFVSTCSNYVISKKKESLDEKSPLKPLSLYAKAKVDAEKYIISKKNNTSVICTILRFATAFGVSPRMRFDLTINEFVKTLFLNKTLDVYDADTWRPYCHVKDFAKFIEIILNSDSKKVNFQIFNAGSSQNNFTKRMLVNEIFKIIPNGKINFLNKTSNDMRDYNVDFSKAFNTLKFKNNWNIEQGIKEIINELKNKKYFFNDRSLGNYEIFYKQELV